MTKKSSASIRWTPEQLAAHLKRKPSSRPQPAKTANAASSKETPIARLHALGRLKTGEKNKTEEAYEAFLQADRSIVWFSFEGIKLRLADNTFYTPDFFAMRDGGQLECHEVKGFWKDDARVKIKVAAALYPFRFLAVTKRAAKDGGGWSQEEF